MTTYLTQQGMCIVIIFCLWKYSQVRGTWTLELDCSWLLKSKIFSLVENTKTLPLYFTLWAQRPKGPRKFEWMQNVHGVYVAYRDYCFMVYWILHQSPPQKGGPNTKLGDHESSKCHNSWFILYYCVEWPTWIGWWWNSIWLRSWLRMSSHYIWRLVSHDIHFPWYGLWMSSKGPQNFMVTALGHSVEWPLVLEMCIVADAETILLNYDIFLFSVSLSKQFSLSQCKV